MVAPKLARTIAVASVLLGIVKLTACGSTERNPKPGATAGAGGQGGKAGAVSSGGVSEAGSADPGGGAAELGGDAGEGGSLAGVGGRLGVAGADAGEPGSVGGAGGAEPPAHRAGVALCGDRECSISNNDLCCYHGSAAAPECGPNGICGVYDQYTSFMDCDSAADCEIDEGEGVCCYDVANVGGTRRGYCVGSCAPVELQLCDPEQAGECEQGICQPTTANDQLPLGYHGCL